MIQFHEIRTSKHSTRSVLSMYQQSEKGTATVIHLNRFFRATVHNAYLESFQEL